MKRTFILLALVVAGCGRMPGTLQPSASSVPSVEVTVTDNPTATLTLSPTPTKETFATPTAEAPAITQTGTSTIIEVTPLATPSGETERKDLLGTYTPYNRMNIRTCPAVTCPIWGMLSGGVPQRVVAMLIVRPGGDLWLCVDPMCDLVVAWWVGMQDFGELVLD